MIQTKMSIKSIKIERRDKEVEKVNTKSSSKMKMKK